jgi:hypothetical protein
MKQSLAAKVGSKARKSCVATTDSTGTITLTRADVIDVENSLQYGLSCILYGLKPESNQWTTRHYRA